MTSPRKLADKDEGFVLGKWFDSIAGLVEAYPSVAGIERNKTVTYNRTTASDFGRDFNASSQNKRRAPDEERARAGRHIYTLDAAGAAGGLDDKHMQLLRDVSNSLAIRSFGPDVMLEKMQKLFDTGKKHGIRIAIHEAEPGSIVIDVTPAPKPQPVSKPRPPRMKFGRGF